MLNSPGYQYWVTPEFRRILDVDSAPERKYRRRDDQVKTVIHWGQRKLLLSEIEFLTLVGHEKLKGSVVVYAGAAPGTHVGYLSALFPSVFFVLVDPAPFTVIASDSIQIIRDMFTDELALQLRELHGVDIYFISDIRTADPDRDSLGESESKIKSDMAAQMRWHTLIGSRRSMFKFRLPWDQECCEYLDGDVYLPVWGPQTTTESRLVTKDDNPAAVRVYDHEKYESQMFHFNSITRVSLYQHDVTAPGLDHCYDCTVEAHILGGYLRMRDPDVEDFELSRRVGKMSKIISGRISQRRTLCDPNPDKIERKRAIRKRQYEDGCIPAYEVARLRGSSLNSEQRPD